VAELVALVVNGGFRRSTRRRQRTRADKDTIQKQALSSVEIDGGHQPLVHNAAFLDLLIKLSL
jgi:hypothetical protein